MKNGRRTLLLSIAAFGLIIPNGLFFYFIFNELSSIHQVMNDHLALGFIIDAFMATGLLAWWFAEHPLGRYSWKTFVALSLLGGLGFSLPFFYYLNNRSESRKA
jgi:Na+/H+ antiporter NhaA